MIEVKPRQLLEDGIRRELVKKIADALHRTGRDDITLTTIDREDHHIALHRPDLVADAAIDLDAPASGSGR